MSAGEGVLEIGQQLAALKATEWWHFSPVTLRTNMSEVWRLNFYRVGAGVPLFLSIPNTLLIVITIRSFLLS